MAPAIVTFKWPAVPNATYDLYKNGKKVSSTGNTQARFSMVNGDVLEARAVIPQIPPTVPTESPDKTTVPPAAQVVDSGLHVYTLAPATITGHTGNAVFRDGVETNSWVVASIGYYNKQVYHKNTAGDWYLWDGTSAWTGPVADPSGAAPPPVTGTNH